MEKNAITPSAEMPPKAKRDSPAPHGSESFGVTQKQLARAFTEWERRYREEPDRFMSEAAKLLKEMPETYGDACAPYLLKILVEQQSAK